MASSREIGVDPQQRWAQPAERRIITHADGTQTLPFGYLPKFFKFLWDKAAERREAAGFNGAMHDGGAREIEAQIRIYEAGQKGVMPEAWVEFQREFDRATDPEYTKYLELKKKFE
jgi:hypothetical protein